MCQGGNFPCYAYRLANGRLKNRYLANKNTATQNYDEDSYPFYPRFWAERLEEFGRPVKAGVGIGYYDRKPKGIFVCDMGELFGDWIPRHWQTQIFGAIQMNPQHRFYLLTKQPQNLIKFSPFPDNCWVGVTATNQGMYDSAVYHLNHIEASVKYISIEPLLSHIHLPNYRDVDWVIIGAMTGFHIPFEYRNIELEHMPWGRGWAFQPKIEWVDEIVRAADKAGVKVFLKNNLKPLLLSNKGFGNVSPGSLIERVIETGLYKLRQEMPKEDGKDGSL